MAVLILAHSSDSVLIGRNDSPARYKRGVQIQCSNGKSLQCSGQVQCTSIHGSGSWRLSTLQLQTNLACRHLKSFLHMCYKTTQVYWKFTTGSVHNLTQIRKVVKRESRVQTQCSNAAEMRVTNQCITMLVNEQETIPNHGPNTLVPSGT